MPAYRSAALTLLAATACAAFSSPGFDRFKRRYGKAYTSADAEARARDCWAENLAKIAAHDPETSGVALGENVYSDLCWADFSAPRLMPPLQGTCWKSPIQEYNKSADLSQSIDWRDQGAVTPVKNQGACGSCWSFSATGSMEGAWFKKTGKLLSFSEQELVSCDTGGQDNGCKGGGPDTAFQWVISNGGISTEEDYPYTGKDDSCDTTKAKNKTGEMAEFMYLDRHNESKVLAALQHEGPVSIVVQATPLWQQYKGGIVTQKACGASGSGIDHAVLAVGYGEESGQKYWIVKNSWGPQWGEQGYIRLAFNENACNCAVCFSYLVRAGKPKPGPGPGPGPGPSPPSCTPQTTKSDCDKVKGCHWCPIGVAGFCFADAQKCPMV